MHNQNAMRSICGPRADAAPGTAPHLDSKDSLEKVKNWRAPKMPAGDRQTLPTPRNPPCAPRAKVEHVHLQINVLKEAPQAT
uniref:Uncharacterized protein n=1 Tax=Romanomermis culicivorax TaxID=13658 RepID=A0A915IFJ2_ROMCU